jgi:hypothetical protein
VEKKQFWTLFFTTFTSSFSSTTSNWPLLV